MNNPASLKSIESLKQWFTQAGRPYWTVWNGFLKKDQFLVMRNHASDDMDTSWELLENIVRNKTQAGGRLTVFVSDKAASSSGFTEYLDIDGPMKTQAGIAGVSSGSYVNGIDSYINDKMALYDKDRRIQDLENELAAKEEGTGINKILNRVLEEAPVQEILLALLSKFMGHQPAGNPAVNGAPRITDDMEQEPLSETEQQRLHDAILRLSAHFPDIATAMEQLANFVDQNPAMAKSFFEKK